MNWRHGEPFMYKTFGFCYSMLLELMFADDYHGVVFLYLNSRLALNFCDTVNVTWTSPFPKPMLYTFCYNATTNGLISGSSPFLSPSIDPIRRQLT